MDETDLFTPQEFAHYRRCSVRTLDRERADGRGCPYVKIGARVLYRHADIDRFVAAHLRGGDRGGVADIELQPRRRSRPTKRREAEAVTP
jgi:hypothetical protein